MSNFKAKMHQFHFRLGLRRRPHVRNAEKYADCRMIGGGGNTDVCPGRQTPSRRHCEGGIKY